jgi:hypothetical protein
LRRKPKEGNIDMDTQKKLSDLEQLCGGDKETYEALLSTMFLDPRKISIPMAEAAENAKRLEKAKNLFRARIWYEIAGGLAIYEGDPKKVAEYFSAGERVSGLHYSIAKNPEKAVAIAKEYYQKHLKALA